MAADMKSEKGKGKSRGGGRGRGRGGRGKASAAAASSAPPEMTPEQKAGKRSKPPPSVATPERRVLFPDPLDEETAPAMETSPPAKQPKKRTRASKAKAKPIQTTEQEVEIPATQPDPEIMEESTAEMQEEGQEDVEPKKPISQETTSTKVTGRKAKKVTKAKAKAKAQSAPAADSAKADAAPADAVPAEAVPAEPKERKIGKAAQKSALNHLRATKETDEAAWFHVKELYKASKFHKLSNKHEVPKYCYWTFSMYWSSGRVGLLQKKDGKSVHVISFGGVNTRNIAMSAQAARMYVTWFWISRTGCV